MKKKSDSFLEDKVKNFCCKYLQPEDSIVIGLSGGGDSMCLFHLLLQISQEYPLNLHVAHVDHGWREKSTQESLYLKALCRDAKINFHCTQLSPIQYKGNWEECAREERLQFFKNIVLQTASQGVFLAHHQDDQVETILKRILEGSPLCRLVGMLFTSHYQGMNIYRPFLNISKKCLIDWLQRKHIDYFSDPTNEDNRFLRARMRQLIIPNMEAEFGKSIQPGLLKLCQEAFDHVEYLDARIQYIMQEKVFTTNWGLLVDLRDARGVHKVELAHLLRCLCRLLNIVLSLDQIHLTCQLLQERAANKNIPLISGRIEIDRGVLCIFSSTKPFGSRDFESEVLREGQYQVGGWEVNCRQLKNDEQLVNQRCHWIDVWKGDLLTYLPEGNYFFTPTHSECSIVWKIGSKRCSKQARKWWSDSKVPHFIVGACPIIRDAEYLVEDFMTGKGPYGGLRSLSKKYQVSLKRCIAS